MKRRFPCIIWLGLSSVIVAALRFWNIRNAYTTDDLPIPRHPSTILLASFCVVTILSFLVISRVQHPHTPASVFPTKSRVPTGLVALLILSGAIAEFFVITNYYVSLLLLLLGVAAGVLLLTAALRKDTRGTTAMLLLLVYLLVKLIINFKAWSVDPIILDYFIPLFGMIFILSALYYHTGILFGFSRPRRTLFFCMGACFFSLATLVDGALRMHPHILLTYSAFCLWNFAIAFRLLNKQTD